MATDETRIAPDEALAAEALAGRLLDPAVAARLRCAAAPTRPPPRCPTGCRRISPDRTGPRSSPGARATRCASASTGIFTYAGFHDVVLARLEDVAAQAELDRSVFAGGCEESAGISVDALAEDMLKLYYDDFIAQWDALLRDLTLAPITDLAVASENLKDLANPDSALRRLLTAIAAETDLARPADAAPPRRRRRRRAPRRSSASSASSASSPRRG